ncbi:phosphotransferase family protein [Curtobacterium ammoniigenes]|uniref:phosphotransferase family protein n=1 Tax=Curtobacterium ammoniigenes TaxID=395387 RepID=UPI0009FAE467|nr:phosphotransferase family protein [Curtobacterium ammoniigenes]
MHADSPPLPEALGDTAALGAFLRARGILDEPFTAAAIGDGHSNLTFVITGVESGRRVVLRRPPDHGSGSYDVLREARFIQALAGTTVPVPRVLATADPLNDGGAPLPVACFVETYVPGVVVTTATPDALADPATRLRCGLAMADALATLHAVDPERARRGGPGSASSADGRAHAGPRDGSDPGQTGPNRRLVERLARLVQTDDGEVEGRFRPAHDWLLAHAPAAGERRIVHGDYRLGNIMFDPSSPGRIAAILDWELATIGDPRIDLAWMLLCTPDPGEPPLPIHALDAALAEQGWPSRAALLERYEAAAGHAPGPLEWFTVLAAWKLAALYAYSARTSADPYYDDDTHVTRFLDAANRRAGIAA